MNPARIFYVPNESGNGRQFGVRRALADLQRTGLVGEVEALSLLWRIRDGGDAEEHRQSLIRAVGEFQPDIVLMQHLGGTGLTSRHFATLRATGEFRFIYHEADPYTRILHPLPREARLAGRWADVVFTVGTGVFARNFDAVGAADVRWESSIYDPGRFGLAEASASERPFDVVMIANRNTPRLRGLPNWRDRIRFVERLQERFGTRFAIYGRGWHGPSAQGPIPYSEQNQAIHSGWVSANWDHFASEPDYFSDRLPTSLATGTIHATTWHPGFDKLFGDETRGFLLTDRSLERLIDGIEYYLDTSSPTERITSAQQAQTYAARHFRQDDQLVRMLNAGGADIAPEAANAAWDLRTDGIAAL